MVNVISKLLDTHYNKFTTRIKNFLRSHAGTHLRNILRDIDL